VFYANLPSAVAIDYNGALEEVMTQDLTIIYERTPDGWWVATIPEIPGAFSQGKSKEEARENVLDAMSELMTARKELALRDRQPDSETESLPLATSP
jgi:predicted RNase H-like HicB family nuclease